MLRKASQISLVAALIVRKVPPRLDDLAQSGIDALDGIGGVRADNLRNILAQGHLSTYISLCKYVRENRSSSSFGLKVFLEH